MLDAHDPAEPEGAPMTLVALELVFADAVDAGDTAMVVSLYGQIMCIRMLDRLIRRLAGPRPDRPRTTH